MLIGWWVTGREHQNLIGGEGLKTLLEGPQVQNYLPASTKRLFTFFTLSSVQERFPEATLHVIMQQSECKVI